MKMESETYEQKTLQNANIKFPGPIPELEDYTYFNMNYDVT